MAQAASLVMTSVYCRSDHRVLMAWKIIHIGEPGRTVEQFFHDVAVSHIESSSSISNIKLDCAYLGRSKESLDQTKLSDRVVNTIGLGSCRVWRISSVCGIPRTASPQRTYCECI